MSGYIPATLRRAVAVRAQWICEYCLIHEDDTFFGCRIEHIISQKHGGATSEANLAYACIFCNRHKGSDISSISQAGQLVRLYNPRTDDWFHHFKFAADRITILSADDIGEATVRLLELNIADRILERQSLLAIGRYPSTAAMRKLRRHP